MKHTLSLAVLFVCTSVANAQAIEINRANLRSLVDKYSPSVRAAKSSVELARAKKREATADLRPNITQKIERAQNYQEESAGFGGTSFPTEFYSTQSSLTLSLALDVFGSKRSLTSQRGFLVSAEESNFIQTTSTASFAAERSLIDYSQRLALAEAAKADLKESQARLDRTKKRFEQGLVSQFEVLQSESDVATYEASLSEAVSNVQLALLDLRGAIGIAPNEEIRVEPETYDFKKVPTSQVEGGTPLHPSLVALQNEVEASRQAVRNANLASRPSFSLSVSYVNNDSPVRLGGQQSGAITLSISTPIADGGSRRARADQEKAALEKSIASLEAKRIELDTKTSTAHQTFIARADKYRSLLLAETKATEALRTAQKRYEAGVATQGYLDLVAAETTLVRARTNTIGAYFDLQRSQIDIREATGAR